MRILPTHSSSRPHHLTLDDVLPGCFYVIDPSTIPPKYHQQFKQIRIVMVCERTESRISLRFPSTHSLRCHFSRISATPARSGGVGKNNLPPLGEKYFIGSEMACQLLLRRVSPEELAERKTALDFWVAPNTSSPVVGKTNNADGEGDDIGMSMSSLTVSKRGSCWSELRGTDMVSWGKRRRVRFLNRHEETLKDKPGQLLALTQGCEGTKDGDDDQEEDGEEVPENMDDENEVKSPVRAKTNWTQRRKHLTGDDGAGTSKKISRRNPIQSRGKQVQVYARSNWRKAKLTAVTRWSVERYKLAEENMLKIMKEKGAVFNHPILRPALRTEARKLIGDTGLLDHLLKHMSGKLAPGGKERFRRRHNADGAMEYWLESADLVDLRRQAGVDDPFWTPPHGWKLGDNPSQDPTCAREIRELREEVAPLKREIEQLATAIFDRQGNQLVAVTAQTSCNSGLNFEQVAASIISLKEMCNELARKDSAREEQLWEMALSLNETKTAMEELKAMKEEMGKLNWALGESNSSGSGKSTLTQLMVMGNDAGAGCEDNNNILHKKEHGRKKNSGTQTVDADAATDETLVAMLKAQRAEKLRRLRSGFEICKPQTLTKAQLVAPAAVVQQLVAVPTPPAVSSFSMAAASPLSQSSPPGQQGQPQTGSPFKPTAERLALTVRPSGNEYSSTVAINLNE